MTARVETKFTADTRDIERRLAQLDNRIDKFAQGSARRMTAVQNSVTNIDKSTGNLGRTLASMSGAFAAAFSVQEAVRLADTFTQFEAKLVNANVAAKDMAKTQEKLFAIAKANGSEIVAIGDLYGSLSMATRDLGTSQSDLTKITETVAASLKLSSASTAQASSTILQLGQAIAGGKLQAQEYNSIIDASPALMRGLAESIPAAAGNMGKLRQMMLDGKLTVDLLVPALVRMRDEMVNKAAQAPTTVAMALQNLQTEIIRYIGQADQSLGATDKLAFAIKALGDNLETMGEVLALAATLFAARYAAGVAVATASNIRYQMTLLGMAAAQANVTRATILGTTAMRGLSAAMALAGGPWGIAFIAIAAAIYFVAKAASNGSAAQQALKVQTERTSTALSAYEDASKAAANATGDAKKKALEHAAAMKIEAEQAVATSRALLMKARAARIAAAQEAQASYQALIDKGATAGSHTSEPARARAIVAEQALERARAEEFQAGYDFAEADNQLRQINTSVANGSYKETPTVTAPKGDKDKGKTSSGPSPEEVTRNSEELERTGTRRLAELEAEIANTAEARHTLALQRLGWEREDADRAVDRQLEEKQITATAAATAKAANETLLNKGIELQNANRAREIEEKRIQALSDQAQFEDNIARILDTTARNRAGLADTLAERLDIERQAFDAYQVAEKAAMDARHEEARARERLNGAIDAEAERRRQAEADAFAGYQKSEKDVFNDDQRKQNPFAKHVDAAKDWQNNVANAMSDGLDDLGDGLTDVIMKTQELGDMFKNVSKQIIADLMRIAVQKAIIAPLANMLGFGDGGGIMNLLGGGKPPARKAIGTNFSQGGMTLVGEAGPELLNLPKGSQVLPNGDVRKLTQQGRSMSGGAPVFNFTNNVYANDALMAGEIEKKIAIGNAESVQAARSLVFQSMSDQQQRTVRR